MKFAMSELCKEFGLTRQGYSKARAKAPKAALKEEMVVKLVGEVRRRMPRLGGAKAYHLVKEDMKAMGIKLGRDRFFGVLREQGLLIEARRSRTRTTNSMHRYRVWPNRIEGLEVVRADQVWVSDITYIRCREGFEYLFLVTDVWSRKIVGWALEETLEARWSLKALTMAAAGAVGPLEGLIHHSDRGVQYCSEDYVAELLGHKALISMAERGNPYENAIAERVNGILKGEFLLDRTMEDGAVARRAVREAIEIYNTERPHMSIGLMKPAQRYRRNEDGEGERKAA